MHQQWRFEQDDQGQWQWKLVDTEQGTVNSPGTFANQTECMIAAVRFAVQRRRSQTDTSTDTRCNNYKSDALQRSRGAHRGLRDPQPNPDPEHQEERRRRYVRVAHEARRDLARELCEGLRTDRQDIVDQVALARLRSEQPQQTAAQEHHPRDFDESAKDADQQNVEWHGGAHCTRVAE